MEFDRHEKLKYLFLNNKSPYVIDDITYNDLNIDSIFDHINNCRSSLGEEVLYTLLRQPLLDQESLNKRESLIEKYRSDNILKKETLSLLSKLSKVKRISVFKYLDLIDDIKNQSFFYINCAWILILISVLLLFINTTLGICTFVLFYFYNAVTYFKKRNLIKPYFICFSYLSKSISIGKKIKGLDSDRLSKIDDLKGYFIFLGQMNGETVSGNNNPLDLILDILRMGLHYDIIVFYLMKKKVSLNKEYIKSFLIDVGTIDALISVGDYRNKLKQFTIPVHNDSLKFTIKGLGHPLLNNPVRNDFEADKSVLLTGCNASGKSTFLRSVAINMILSQTIHTCTCEEYIGPICKVITSMSLKDDLIGARSFYMAEIEALKRIIDFIDSEKDYQVVSFVDEVLRGTNTVERISASSEILKYLSTKCLSFAATHDIELTAILKDYYNNYHFNEGFKDSDFDFDFIIKEGPADTRNAIKLLKLKGFPESITDNAEILADSFDSKTKL